MCFGKDSTHVIVDADVAARDAGVVVALDDLEAHHLAGGDVLAAVANLASAKEGGRKEDFRTFSAKGLSRHEVV